MVELKREEFNMKRLIVCTVAGLITICILGSQQSYAQSDAAAKRARLTQDQIMKELLNEVQQLRLELRRMSINIYRAQMVVERLRVQQEQVLRLTLEQNKVNTEISELRSARPGLKEQIEALEKKWETGLIPDTEIKAAKAAMERLNNREQSLVEREPQLAAELNAERGNLEALKARLDEIEREILTIGK